MVSADSSGTAGAWPLLSKWLQQIPVAPIVALTAAAVRSAVGHVHRDFHTEAQVNGSRCFPFHMLFLY